MFDGLILKWQAITVHQVLRKDILPQIHEGYFGYQEK